MPAVEHAYRAQIERRLLQAAIILAACVPVLGGLAGIIMGARLLDGSAPDQLSFDSHARYLSGLLLGIGLAFWSFVPQIERIGGPFCLLTAVIVTGGLARLASFVVDGQPSLIMQCALVMELCVTPLLCLWQNNYQRRAVG